MAAATVLRVNACLCHFGWLHQTWLTRMMWRSGDYTGSQPCDSNTFNGQTIQVYDPTQLVGNNNEVVW